MIYNLDELVNDSNEFTKINSLRNSILIKNLIVSNNIIWAWYGLARNGEERFMLGEHWMILE